MGSRVSRVMGFLPANFQLPVPFHSRLRVRHGTDGQKDGQTDDGHQLLMPTGTGGDGIINVNLQRQSCIVM